MTETTAKRIRLGVSACLLGHEVRYDGTHKRHSYLVEELGREFDVVAVCPESELGLGVPREKIQLVTSPAGVRLVTTEEWYDITADMRHFSRKRVAHADIEALSGYVFKSRSPSCGVRQVKLYSAPGEEASFRRTGRGIFAAILIEHYPLLPIIEEDVLADPVGRDDFIRRVRAYAELHADQGQA